jgi:hypothetical protein
MTLTQERKQEIIQGYQVHETDTGSADVQIAMLTDRINRLSDAPENQQKRPFFPTGIVEDDWSTQAFTELSSQGRYGSLSSFDSTLRYSRIDNI